MAITEVNTLDVKSNFVKHFSKNEQINETVCNILFDLWLEDERNKAKAEAYREAQQIIAGFEHTIDEARNRGDMINTGYLIQEIDTEIQDLLEGDDV